MPSRPHHLAIETQGRTAEFSDFEIDEFKLVDFKSIGCDLIRIRPDALQFLYFVAIIKTFNAGLDPYA